MDRETARRSLGRGRRLAGLVLARTPSPLDLLSERARERWARRGWPGATGPGSPARPASTSASTTSSARTLPASPPSRLRYARGHPEGRAPRARAAGSPPSATTSPGVEFVVKVRQGGREETVWTQLARPRCRGPPTALGARRTWTSRRYAGRGRELVLETRGFEQDADDARRAFWGDARASPCRDGDAPLVVVYLVDTLRADHTTPYGYARDTTPELAALRAGRRGLRAGDRARVLDQALGGVALHLAAARPAPRGPAPRQPRPRPRHAGGDAAGQGLRHRRRHRQLGHLLRRARTSSRASTSSPGCTAPATGPRRWWRRRAWWTPPSRWLDERRGFPTFLYVHTMDPHVPYAPARRPSTGSTSRTRRPGHPAVDPAQRLQGAAGPRADDRPVRRRRSPTATRSSAASCAS